MEGRKNFKQKKNKRNREVFSMLEGVYSRTWHIGKRRESRRCKGSNRGIWGKNECRSKKVRKVGQDREKEL